VLVLQEPQAPHSTAPHCAVPALRCHLCCHCRLAGPCLHQAVLQAELLSWLLVILFLQEPGTAPEAPPVLHPAHGENTFAISCRHTTHSSIHNSISMLHPVHAKHHTTVQLLQRAPCLHTEAHHAIYRSHGCSAGAFLGYIDDCCLTLTMHADRVGQHFLQASRRVPAS
jgi:hypothetical protein